MPQEERAQIDAVQRRLAQKYAELPHDHVAAVVQHVYARFNQSTVRDYVPLLVERRAREELTRSTAGPGGGCEVWPRRGGQRDR
jgi:CRISPR/Cas system-associated exonuclease Cas4 (RecB family)